MMENKNKTQEEQLEKEIKFILQLFNSNKLKSAEKEIQKQLKKHYFSTMETLDNKLETIVLFDIHSHSLNAGSK